MTRESSRKSLTHHRVFIAAAAATLVVSLGCATGAYSEKVTLTTQQMFREVTASRAPVQLYFPYHTFYENVDIFGCASIMPGSSNLKDANLVQFEANGTISGKETRGTVNVSNYIGTNYVFQNNQLTKLASSVSPVELNVKFAHGKPVWFGMMVEGTRFVQDATGMELEFEGADWRGTIPLPNVLQFLNSQGYQGFPGHHGGTFSADRQYAYFHFLVARGFDTVRLKHVGWSGKPEKYSFGHFCFGDSGCPSCRFGPFLAIDHIPEFTVTTTTTRRITTTASTTQHTDAEEESSDSTSSSSSTVPIVLGAAAGGLAALGVGGGVWYVLQRGSLATSVMAPELSEWDIPTNQHQVARDTDDFVGV